MLSLPPIDARVLPGTLSAGVRADTELARQLRASPGKNVVEGLLALENTGPEAFNSHVARQYIKQQFGEAALDNYLATLPNAAELLPLARQAGFKVSPLATATRFGPQLMSGAPFIVAPHLMKISDLILSAIRGTGKRKIAIATSFRHGKSLITSLATPLWFLSNYPNYTIGLTTNSDSLSTLFSRTIRDVLRSNPKEFGFDLAVDSQSVHQMHTAFQGGLWVGSPGSSILGKGCELAICDDLIASPEQAGSRAELEKIWNWFLASLQTRVQSEGIILLTSTRWSKNDLYGKLERGDDGVDSSEWEFLTMPALAVEDDDCLGRKKGDALFPRLRPLSELEGFKRGMTSEAWECGFMQRPLESQQTGRAYSNFNIAEHVREVEVDPERGILIGADFNVDHLSFVLMQQREVIDDHRRYLLCNERRFLVEVFDELCIANCVTSEAVGALMQRLLKLPFPNSGGKIPITITGDSSGSARRTSASESLRTDWDIFKDVVYVRDYKARFNVTFDIPKSNPAVLVRVGTANKYLKDAADKVHLTIHPRCRGVIEDLQQVRWLRDKYGNTLETLDKRDPDRTHLSDALTYGLMVVESGQVKFGLKGGVIPGGYYGRKTSPMNLRLP